MCSPTASAFALIGLLATIFNCLHLGLCVVIAAPPTPPPPSAAPATPLQSAGADASGNTFVGSRVDSNTATEAEAAEASTITTHRIHIIRKRSVQLNGVKVDEDSLIHHLADHERELIFGRTIEKRNIKLVHLRHQTDAADTVVDASGAPHRSKRSDTANGTQARNNGAPQPQQEISVQIQDNDQLVNLKLRQTPKLIDEAFIFIRRFANSTQIIEDSHLLAAKYERCFYSNENSALDLCDDANVRGIFHHNSTDFIIHPLPERFGKSTHVILEKNEKLPYSPAHSVGVGESAKDVLDPELQFEPDEVDFNEPNSLQMIYNETAETSRPTRNINFTYYGSSSTTEGTEEEEQERHRNHQQSWHIRYKPRYHFDEQKPPHHRKQRKHHHKKPPKDQAHHSHHEAHDSKRQRRHISSSGSQWKIPQVLHIETAIFVDSDLFKHMAKNFPTDTDSHLMRFVLAMINGVQLLYHHPSLGHRVNFVLKRLEILYKDPQDLRRSSDIDTYLSNFCTWQRSLNPPSDADPMHFDHAVILTGVDLYVVGKNGKVISQVVGLAPVAGMCTATSSCTINEGKHFESVFVVAHEIGHNLGMRHDTMENSCDPSLHIMSPTLGSGKITWSKCSRTYLNTFLETTHAKCIFDRGQFINNLDHLAEGMLPGERFDADQQCMLKYGKDSVRALTQVISDICRDLHCQRDRYTWTSHPALEGTDCGANMWCRSGVCVARPTALDSYSAPKQLLSKPGYDKAKFVDTSKMGHLLHEYNYNKAPTWGEWGEASECDSGCLYGPSNRLSEGSTGLRTYTRSCLDYRRRCLGRDRKFESCIAKQCYSIALTTVKEFATQACEKAQRFDKELTGVGEQIVGNIEESCKVFCKTKTNGTKSRSWTFPDGTTCRSNLYDHDTSYCIAGRCEKFSCDNSTNNYYKIDPIFCQHRQLPPPTSSRSQTHSSEKTESKHINEYNMPPRRYAEREGDRDRTLYNGYHAHKGAGGMYVPTTYRSKYENEVALRSFPGQDLQDQSYKRKVDTYGDWNKYNYHTNEAQSNPPVPPLASASLVSTESDWIVKSGCHSSCMSKSKGIQVVTNRRTGANNIQLCTHAIRPCERLLTTTEFAENTCARYKLKVRGLSGLGTQIAASIDEPDRSCRVGCQDEFIKYRFYLVNGKYGQFPLGTKCSHSDERYCVNGKCLEFGRDNIPLQQSHISLALFRNRRSIEPQSDPETTPNNRRQKRSFLYYDPVNITETLTQEFLNSIVNSIMEFEKKHFKDEPISSDHIEFSNPIHMSTDELTHAKPHEDA